MDEYDPVLVYGNLVKMLTNYRRVKLSAPAMDSDSVAQKLNHYEFVTISGTRDEMQGDPRGKAKVITILIAPNSKYSGKSGDFKKLFKELPKTNPGESLEVIFVSDADFTSHIKKHIQQFRIENPTIIVEDHNYEIFLIEVPAHTLVPKHIVVSNEEIDTFCRLYYMSKDRFQKILQSDPQAVWLGLRPGMCVKIIRDSETAGTAPVYRICVK